MAHRPARISDVHRTDASMPHLKRVERPNANAIHQVGGKPFVFFGTSQPVATDPDTGGRYADPFFTTDHRNGPPQITMTELGGLIAPRVAVKGFQEAGRGMVGRSFVVLRSRVWERHLS